MTHPLHPETAAWLGSFPDGPGFDFSQLSAVEFRAAFEAPSPTSQGAPMFDVSDRMIETGSGAILIRIYRPLEAEQLPATIFFHGGGFVIGGPDMTDSMCRTLAVESGGLVVSVHYRLAPEAPFPCGLEDSYAALQWVSSHADELGIDDRRIAVAGDSSGGNFAAALAQISLDEGPAICHQLLLYPVLDSACSSESFATFADGYFLTSEMMRWFWRQYLPSPDIGTDVRASPIRRADLTGLAPATIVTAECDVLRDEAEAYGAALLYAGVPVYCRRWHGQVHGFLLQQGVLADADKALKDAGQALRLAFIP